MTEPHRRESIQVRFGGFGGQGIMLAGTLLGKAASLYDGKEAVFTQAYGPEARGGASRCDLIIAEEPVDYPYVTEPDILAVLFQEAYTKFGSLIKPGRHTDCRGGPGQGGRYDRAGAEIACDPTGGGVGQPHRHQRSAARLCGWPDRRGQSRSCRRSDSHNGQDQSPWI